LFIDYIFNLKAGMNLWYQSLSLLFLEVNVLFLYYAFMWQFVPKPRMNY